MEKKIYERIRSDLETELREKYRKKYSENNPMAEKRVREEWQAVLETENLISLAETADLAFRLQKEKLPYWVRGTGGSSFLLYLLGVTGGNPLPPHFYCPRCRRIFPAAGKKDGWDLPGRLCPVCGAPCLPDGHNIPWQIHWGCGEKSCSVDFQADCGLGGKIREAAETHWLRKLEPETELRYTRLEGGSAIVHLGAVSAACTGEFGGKKRKASGILYPFPLNRAVRLYREHFEEEGIPLPETAADLISSLGLIRENGTWNEELRNRMEKEHLAAGELVVFRDDLFRRLRDTGCGLREALDRALHPDRETENLCGSPRYLFPRAHWVEALLFRLQTGL